MDALENWLGLKGLLVILAVFVPLERLIPAHPRKIFRPGWQNDLAHFFVSGLLIKIGLMAVIALAIAAGELIVPAEVRAWVGGRPGWVQFIALVAVSDLAFYAVHRAFHSNPALWRYHMVHHSIQEMDWLAAHRVHPVDQILTKGAALVPCFALGFSGWVIAAYFLFYHWHSLLLHANVKVSFGPLRWLIASPDFHHWHHSERRDAWNRNFSGQLALWDLIFGTMHLPKGERSPSFGLGDAVPRTYLAQLLYPFRATKLKRPAQPPVPAERQSLP